ncbi:MAG: SMC family ATPase, partial [Spirochaetaceae bacterium]|nr:SMC family ATPase [Spirochaetaceae bacterium]
LRSDFCSPEDEAFVSMNYILHGKSITVKRILPCLRVNRNGKITEKAEELTIYINKNGQEEAVQGKHTELNNYIEESIGLTADEFSRIVLLPQGEFADFLFQSSTQRAETLAKLFPVQKYEDILQTAKTKHTLLSADLTSVKNQLAEFGGDYNPDNEQEIIAEQESLLKKGNKELDQLKDKLVELQIKQNNLDSLIKKFDDEARFSQELEKLALQKNQIDEIQNRLDIANLVEPAAIACDEALREQDKLFRLQKDKEENQKQLEKVNQILSSLREKENEYTENTKKYEQISVVLQELKNAVSLEQELETLSRNIKNIETEINANTVLIEKFQQEEKALNEQLSIICSNKELNTEDLTQKIVELNSLKQSANTILTQAKDKTSLAETLDDLQKQRETENEELDKLTELLDKARKKQNELQFNNFARSLSASLKKGCPCPVCGSKEHPAPHNTQLEFINDSDLDEQKILEENSLLEKQQVNQISKVAQIEGKLSQIKIQFEELKAVPSIKEAEEKYLQIENEYNQALETSRKIQNIQSQLDKIQDSVSEPAKILTELRIQKEGISTKIEEKENNIQKARKSIEVFGLNNFSISDSYNALLNLS